MTLTHKTGVAFHNRFDHEVRNWQRRFESLNEDNRALERHPELAVSLQRAAYNAHNVKIARLERALEYLKTRDPALNDLD